jgi:LPXTG-site transpeptidase (sortase) family protein
VQLLRNPRFARWIVGLIIVFGTIVAFSLYQSYSGPVPASILLPTSIASVPTQAVVTAVKPTLKPTPTALVATPQPYSQRIAIDKIKIVTTIVELYYDSSIDDWNVTTLNRFAGHLQGTPNIGQGGNAVLAGHVELKDGSPGAFAQINLLAQGDRIFILSDDPKKPSTQYVVTRVATVEPTAVDEISNHGYEELTLITCQDYDLKTGVYQKRVVVHARPVTNSAAKAVNTDPLILSEPS